MQAWDHPEPRRDAQAAAVQCTPWLLICRSNSITDAQAMGGRQQPALGWALYCELPRARSGGNRATNLRPRPSDQSKDSGVSVHVSRRNPKSIHAKRAISGLPVKLMYRSRRDTTPVPALRNCVVGMDHAQCILWTTGPCELYDQHPSPAKGIGKR
jgi:hypothetical protein